MPRHPVRVALNKELRAVAPAWLLCLALVGLATRMHGGIAHDLAIGVYVLGAIATGALSMGHEYSGGTLSLLLSQPRRRAHVVLLKVGVLAPLLIVLGAVGLAVGDGLPNPRGVVFVVPLLCGLFIAPWFTMLCRNSLAGIVFTLATPGLLLLIGQVGAAIKFGIVSDPAVVAASIVFETAVLLWGTLAASAVAAVSGWRLFMRLEAVDGPGQAIRLPLPWPSTGTTGAAVPPFAKRHALWLLIKKELRLQQLSFAVAGLYVLAWLAIWAARSTMPNVYVILLVALTGLNALATSLLAGSLASAEERQLGTLAWHVLLPMRIRTQWVLKAAIAVGVACLLGLAVPMALSYLPGLLEIHDGLRPFWSAGAGFAVIFLTIMSLYISSVTASSLQAMLWSLATGFGLMTLASRWSLGVVRRIASAVYFAPFDDARWWKFWLNGSSEAPFLWLITTIALAIIMYAGLLGLLLRFGQANHCSAERNPRRVSRQLVSLGAFFVILQALWFGAFTRFSVEVEASSRDAMRRTYAFVTFAAFDSESRPLTRYTVVVFPESQSRYSRSLSFSTSPESRAPQSRSDGRIETPLLPGRYSAIAVAEIAWNSTASRDPDLIARLKARAVPVTIAAGESKAVQLTVSTY